MTVSPDVTAGSPVADGDSERIRGYVGTPPLPTRPVLSTTDPATGTPVTDPAAKRVQPLVGLAGLTFLAPLFFLLAFGAGGPVTSLEILGPITTFALPVVATIAFWWEDWPGSTLRPGWSGLTDTVLVVAGGLGLTLLGQVVVGGFDAGALFDPGPPAGHVETFPHTMPVAAGVFTAFLQLTMVNEGWPLRRLGRVTSGVTALAVSWAVGVVAFLLVAHVRTEGLVGLRDPGGPVPTNAYGAWLTALGAWQLVFFVALRGWPFTGIRRRAVRLPVANLTVVACAWASYLLMTHAVGMPVGEVTAACGCGVAAILLTAMLFDAWPWTRLSKLPGRTGVVITSVVLAALLYWALESYATTVDFGRVHPEDWVAYSALNAIGMVIIIHVAIWKRWPVVVEPQAAGPPAAAAPSGTGGLGGAGSGDVTGAGTSGGPAGEVTVRDLRS